MLYRLPDWPERLSAFVTERRSMPFQWGLNDCCTFALEGGVKAVTGLDLLPGVPRPTSASAAMFFLNERGHSDPSGLADELLGERLPTPRMAQRGDVVGMSSEHGVSLGICIGSALVAPGVHELVFTPRVAALMAWRV